MILDFEPGDKVINPSNKNWGIGQVQSIIKEKATVNFEGPIPAPINKNDKVAELKVYFKDELLGNYDLLALENIKKQNIISRILTSINFLLWGDV